VSIPALARAAELPDDRDRALPCRPTIACNAEIVPAGTFEVEMGALYRRIDDRGRQWTFPLLLKQSLTDSVQLQVGTNGYSAERGPVPGQYLDDVWIGPKLVLTKQTEKMPSTAIQGALSIPTFQGAKELRTYDILMTAYVTKDIGPVHADVNFGPNVWRIDGRPLFQAFATLALSMNLVDPIGAFVETYVFSDAAPIAPRDGGFLFGLSQTPRPWLVLDEGGDIGFYPTTRSFSLFVGATFIPVVFWR
jgi:hypothetical protein